MTPAGMAIATITVMLWLVWSDTLRARKPTPILYAVRVALYLIVVAVMVVNMSRFPEMFRGSTRALEIAAIVIGLFGAAYFSRRLVRRV